MKTAGVKGVCPQKRRVTQGVKVMSASIMMLALAGCMGREEYAEVKGYLINEPSQNHPIRVSKKDKHTDFVVARGDYGLDRRDKGKFKHLIRNYKQEGVGQLFVRAPAGAPNEVAVRRALGDFRNVMRAENVSVKAVHFDTYAPNGDPEAPITVSYKRYVAKGPNCGKWDSDLGDNGKNTHYKNFGCATQRNFAAMVANPRDLIIPRNMDQRGGERRDVLWDKYVKGEDTSAKKSKELDAGISDAGDK